MSKPLFLFVGKSASGKTSIADMLAVNGYSQVCSYTTRAKRHENEIGHTFISDEEYDKLDNIIASTIYNNHRYCTTLEQIKNADIYVVDVPGVKTLLDNYKLLNRKIYVVFFASSVYSRIQRMLNRDDSDTAIVGRLLTDEKDDWLEQLEEIREKSEVNFHICTINANCELDQVYNTVKDFMKSYIN